MPKKCAEHLTLNLTILKLVVWKTTTIFLTESFHPPAKEKRQLLKNPKKGTTTTRFMGYIRLIYGYSPQKFGPKKICPKKFSPKKFGPKKIDPRKIYHKKKLVTKNLVPKKLAPKKLILKNLVP